jgi:hypothetical protein
MRPGIFPLATSAVAGLLAWQLEIKPVLETAADRIAFASAIASVSVTMLGFMLAALAVLASINHTHLVGMMKKTGHYLDLLKTAFVGASFFLLCALSGYLVLFGYEPTSRAWYVLAGVHVGALVALLDLARKLWMVLENLRQQS